jgi:Protein of unknown function (DUF1217)
MTTTTSSYLAVSQNLPKTLAMTAANPAVKTASAYYSANIGKVTSIKDFVGNYRLLSYALNAYGLGDQINSTALITQVLEGGVANPKSLANTLPQWKAFATAFDFPANGAASVSTTTAVKTTEASYVEQQMESKPSLACRRRSPQKTSTFRPRRFPIFSKSPISKIRPSCSS